jgi:hypothetical protein
MRASVCGHGRSRLVHETSCREGLAIRGETATERFRPTSCTLAGLVGNEIPASVVLKWSKLAGKDSWVPRGQSRPYMATATRTGGRGR